MINISDINYHGDVVVFDLDDTIMRERDYVRSGFTLIESSLIDSGYPAEGVARELEKILNSRGKYFDWLEDWLNKVKAPAETLPDLIELYRNHLPATLHFDESAKSLIDYLSERGIIIGLVTDGRSGTQRAKIKALGLDKYIMPDNILISEETGYDKSSPNNFRQFVVRYPEAKRFFYIADNERKDFMIPNLLGWTTVRQEYNPDNVHEEYINNDILSRPTCVLSKLSDFITEFQPKGY
ncbi:MAG: HAD family hydrolase [Muribaculaceae bacterium]|nr:HAD family hydrolase [Muribaculaceae bacterium]